MPESVNAHIQLEKHNITTCLNSSRVASGPEGTLSGRAAASAMEKTTRETRRRPTRGSGEGGSSKMKEEGKLHIA